MPRDIFLNLIRRERQGFAVPKDEIERRELVRAARPSGVIFYTKNELYKSDVIA